MFQVHQSESQYSVRIISVDTTVVQ